MADDQKRNSRRIPFMRHMEFKVMGDAAHAANRTAAKGEILDLSNSGMKIREEGQLLQEGFVLMVRVPIPETETSVPALAQVKWVRGENTGAREAGVMFIV